MRFSDHTTTTTTTSRNRVQGTVSCAYQVFFLPLVALWSFESASVVALAPVGTLVRRHIGWQLHPQQPTRTVRLFGVSFANQGGEEQPAELEDDREIQWQLFLKHHAKGSWKGIWTTYNYMGDVQDETIASVDLTPSQVQDMTVVTHEHQIVVGAKQSDCATCFDAMDIKTLPVATYTLDTLGQQVRRPVRLGACGMVIGPTVLRSGAMATELVLSHGDGRVRCIFQHAPVWEQGTDPKSGAPPDGLKLFRTMISKEALRPTPPTAESEAGRDDDPDSPNPIFSRPVSPFKWHKDWAGTSWTWGPSTGNRGWQVQSVEEGDAWHGMAPVEVWNLRLPMGGIFVQTPRIMNSASIGLCRVAWLPNDDTLIRLEAGITAFQPADMEEEWNVFLPPSLASYRCDVLTNQGELEGEPQFLATERQSSSSSSTSDDATATEQQQEEEEPDLVVEERTTATTTATTSDGSQEMEESTATAPTTTTLKTTKPSPPKDDEELKDARDALQL